MNGFDPGDATTLPTVVWDDLDEEGIAALYTAISNAAQASQSFAAYLRLAPRSMTSRIDTTPLPHNRFLLTVSPRLAIAGDRSDSIILPSTIKPLSFCLAFGASLVRHARRLYQK